MERKQLDLNAPLISVRRYSSPPASREGVNRKIKEKSPINRKHSLPASKSEWECSEVTKPAAVPFNWEQIPGRPKDEGEDNTRPQQEAPITPRLPPGRSPNVSRYNSGERFNDQNISLPQNEALYLHDHASLLEKLQDSLNSREESDTESGGDTYSDALDALSPTKSYSFNYSVSGLSGSQGPVRKPSGTFSVDPQTRDFMMSRFLPAAKAVVLETPQHVQKKQPAVHEETKPVKKVVSGERKPLLEQYGSNIVSYYSGYIENLESEDDDDDDNRDHVVPVKRKGKAWGIIPRFCVKNSLCLLNPVPGMKSSKVQSPRTPSRTPSRTPTCSAGEVRRLTRNAYSGPLDKSAFPTIYKKKYHSGVLSKELLDAENKLMHESNRFPYPSNSCKTGASGLRRHRSGSISPYRNEAPKSPFREGVGFLGVPKETNNQKADKFASSRKLCNTLLTVSARNTSKQGPNPATDAVEKTLYVDQASTKAELNVDSSSENTKPLAESRENERTCKVESPDKALPGVNNSDGETILHKYSAEQGKMESDTLKQSFGKETKSLECSKMHCDAKAGKDGENDDQTVSESAILPSPLPPPLPKSPSESWLWRTLPSISLPNPFSTSRRISHFHPKKEGQKAPGTDTKWENIVKSSHLHHDHVRYSEELVPHVSRRHNKA